MKLNRKLKVMLVGIAALTALSAIEAVLEYSPEVHKTRNAVYLEDTNTDLEQIMEDLYGIDGTWEELYEGTTSAIYTSPDESTSYYFSDYNEDGFPTPVEICNNGTTLSQRDAGYYFAQKILLMYPDANTGFIDNFLTDYDTMSQFLQESMPQLIENTENTY